VEGGEGAGRGREGGGVGGWWGDRGIAFIFFNAGAGWGEINVTLQSLYPRERDTVPIVLEAGWTAGPVWTGEENLASTGIRSLDRTSRSETLHRLTYPDAFTFTVMV
jgi:hypothetical protein